LGEGAGGRDLEGDNVHGVRGLLESKATGQVRGLLARDSRMYVLQHFFNPHFVPVPDVYLHVSDFRCG
jgi:hypothetical protein